MAEIGPYGRPNAYSLSYDPTYTIPLATAGEKLPMPPVISLHRGEQGSEQEAGKANNLCPAPTYTTPLATTGERRTDPLVEMAHKGEQGWKQDAGKAYKVP